MKNNKNDHMRVNGISIVSLKSTCLCTCSDHGVVLLVHHWLAGRLHRSGSSLVRQIFFDTTRNGILFFCERGRGLTRKRHRSGCSRRSCWKLKLLLGWLLEHPKSTDQPRPLGWESGRRRHSWRMPPIREEDTSHECTAPTRESTNAMGKQLPNEKGLSSSFLHTVHSFRRKRQNFLG